MRGRLLGLESMFAVLFFLCLSSVVAVGFRGDRDGKQVRNDQIERVNEVDLFQVIIIKVR